MSDRAVTFWIESKGAHLSGAPMPDARYTYERHPVSNAVAYSMSSGNSGLVSPFADNPTYAPYNTKLLRAAILRAAKAIIENPKKEVWTVETRDGRIELFVGDYGNVNARVSLGFIRGTMAEKSDPAFANGTMADYNEVYRNRGEPEPYPDAKPAPLPTAGDVSEGWISKLLSFVERTKCGNVALFGSGLTTRPQSPTFVMKCGAAMAGFGLKAPAKVSAPALDTITNIMSSPASS